MDNECRNNNDEPIERIRRARNGYIKFVRQENMKLETT